MIVKGSDLLLFSDDWPHKAEGFSILGNLEDRISIGDRHFQPGDVFLFYFVGRFWIGRFEQIEVSAYQNSQYLEVLKGARFKVEDDKCNRYFFNIVDKINAAVRELFPDRPCPWCDKKEAKYEP